MDQRPDYDDGEESFYPAQQPQTQPQTQPQPQPQDRQSAPQTVHAPAGYSVKQPLAEKRNAILRSAQAGEQKYQEYRENRSQRTRALTQGPPKMLGGRCLSQAELQEKWRSEEAHAKRNQLIADFQKKERRREYQRQDKARQEKEMQEKKSRAREISNRQEITERDRTAAHTLVMTQQRLTRFNSYPISTSALRPKRLTEYERAVQQEREALEALKQQKLEEHAKQQRREEYKLRERDREEREIMDKKMCARELAIKRSISDRERVAADCEKAREQRLKYFDAKK